MMQNQHFLMSLNTKDCVDKILPRLESVTAQLDTIGAVADANGRHCDKVDEFFDPQVHGDCLIEDKLSLHRYSFRHHEQQPKYWQAKQQWMDKKDYWEWTLEIDHLHGDQRELSVELQLPHPIFPGKMGSGHSKWQLWLPIAQESLGNDYGLKKVHFCQCLDEKTDIPFPLCSLFHCADDVSLGLSYLLPPDQNWYTDFEVDQRNWMTKITFKHLGLTEQSAIKLRLWCFSHAGDWRPAVGWVRDQFPELLGPVAGQEKLEGNMAYTIPMIPEKRISDWSQQMHLRWNELFYCRNFGDYFPSEPFDSNHFITDAHPKWAVNNLNYDDINRYIDMCNRHNVKVMPYFNIAECESEIARTKFPESIAKFYNDHERIPWVYYDRKNYNVCMNSDPAYPWFDFVMGQFEQLLKRCPGIDGFFFDQMNYGWIDTAHFDGETFFNNQPAYNMGNMYLRALEKMRKIFPRPRINGIGNGIVRWQMMEYLDGVMAEGDPDALGRFSFLAPERPTICLAEGENAFQNALYYGSWVHVSPYYRYPTTEPLPEDAVKLFAAYTPLMKLLEGRKMVYTPNPLRVEIAIDNLYRAPLLNPHEKIKANIFKTAQSGYAIVILALPKGMTLTNSYLPLTVRVNLPENKLLRQATVFNIEYQHPTLTETALTPNGELEIKVPKHGAATLVLLNGG